MLSNKSLKTGDSFTFETCTIEEFSKIHKEPLEAFSGPIDIFNAMKIELPKIKGDVAKINWMEQRTLFTQMYFWYPYGSKWLI